MARYVVLERLANGEPGKTSTDFVAIDDPAAIRMVRLVFGYKSFLLYENGRLVRDDDEP